MKRAYHQRVGVGRDDPALEHQGTADMFVTPAHQETADYIKGRYG